jgi:hypothetical protein
MTAPTYSATTKTARMTATRDSVGTGGKLLIRAANNDVLVTFILGTDGGTVSGNVWTLNFSNSTVAGSAAAGAGTAATNAVLTTSGDASRITNLSVGTSGTAVILDNVSIAEGQNVTISSATITHAADPA